jgi:xylan 1,4-beta-xylosidase
MGGGDWPDEDQWRRLAEADRLPPVETRAVAAANGTLQLTVDLPMPSITYLELVPHSPTP